MTFQNNEPNEFYNYKYNYKKALKKLMTAKNFNDFKKLDLRFFLSVLILILAFVFFYSRSENSNSDFISATVTRVIDGDTLIANVNGENRRVRLLGVDTPETVHPNKPVQFYGREASNFTKNNLTGKNIWLEYDVSPLDKYNRHLAYLWFEIPETVNKKNIRQKMFNAILISNGYAKTMNIKPNSKYASFFKQLENEARSAKKGLWQ